MQESKCKYCHSLFWLCPACCDAIFSRCVDENGTKFTNLFLFDEKMLHLVDDIFWHLEHAEKVMSQVIKNGDIAIIVISFIISG